MIQSRFFKVIVLAILALAGMVTFYYYSSKRIPDRIAESDYTRQMFDSMRHVFKVSLMNQRALENYLFALRDGNEDLSLNAIDFLNASLGFLNSAYTDNRVLADSIEPIIKQNIEVINNNRVSISEQELRGLKQHFQRIFTVIENRERNIWHSFQADFTRFQSNEYRLQLIYQLIAVAATIMFLIIAVLFFRQKSLTRLVFNSEERIRSLNQELYTIIEHLPNMVFVKDIKTQKFVRLNRAGEELLGRTREEMIGRTDYDIFPREQADFFTRKDRLVIESGDSVNIELEPIETNKGQRFLHTRKVCIFDKENKPRYLLGISDDITEQLKSQQELYDSEQRLNRLLDTIPYGVQECDVNGVITYSNLAHHEMLGFAAGELIGKNIWDFQSDENSKQETRDHIAWLVANRPIPEPFFALNVTSDGRELSLEVVWDYLVDDNDKITGFISVISDITERKRAEEEVRVLNEELEQRVMQRTRELAEAKEIAEAAATAKSKFLANMSHEIRTPMNTIIGMSHLALKTDLNEKQHNYIQKTNSAAEGLLGIIDDILDFSKIESGRLEFESIEFRLEDVMDHLLNLIGLKAEEQGLSLELDIAPEVPTALIGDPLRLGQVLVNLGNNAVKFTEPGGIVKVQVNVLDDDAEFATLRFMVKDSGIGISVDQQARLFEAFAQADASTTRAYGGTGLGLVISRNLVDMMDGKMWLESEPDVGSTFYFTARIMKQQGEPSERRSYIDVDESKLDDALEHLRGAKILLVEDNKLNQELASELLIGNGLEVCVANNGQEALDLLERDRFDGILMDCQMPLMDGYTASREIRKRDKFKNLPIIAMTANAMSHDRLKVLASGMNDHLPKPVNVNQMFYTLAKWIKPGNPGVSTASGHVADQLSDPAAVPDLPGIDVKAGLSFVQGKTELYFRLLNKFRDGQHRFVQSFRTAWGDDDHEVAKRLAHTLKGSSGYIGAKNVQQAACSLEQALDSAQPPELVEQCLNRLEVELDVVLSAIESFGRESMSGSARLTMDEAEGP